MKSAVPTEQVGGTHYRQYLIEPIDFITLNNVPFCQANILKYLCRYKRKGGLEDLAKARHYVKLAVSRESSQIEFNHLDMRRFMEANSIDENSTLGHALGLLNDFMREDCYHHVTELLETIDKLEAELIAEQRAKGNYSSGLPKKYQA